MNLQTDRPTDRPRKSRKVRRRHTASVPGKQSGKPAQSVRREVFGETPLHLFSFVKNKQMWDSDWSWQARSTTVSTLSLLPPAPHKPGNRRGVLLYTASSYPVCGCRCVCFRWFCSRPFYFTSLTFKAGLQLWSQPNLPTRRGSPLWPNNEVGKAAQIPSSSLCFQATFYVSATSLTKGDC